MARLRITKRSNVYQYQFEIAPQDGKRKYINKSGFKTRQEAEEAGIHAYNEYMSAGKPYKECKMSYYDYLDYWLDNYCKNNLKYNTVSTYRTLIEKYIKPKLGMYKLNMITGVTLNKFINEIVEENDFAKSYYKNILKVVKGSFRDACNIYGFIKYNPALTVRLPKIDSVDKNAKHLYTLEEIDMILKRFENDPTFTCAFLTSCFTGMRTGEVFALTWEDIDLENGIINIKNNVHDRKDDGKGRWYLGTTKTTTGTRKVYIGKTLKKALTNFKVRQENLKELYSDEYIQYHIEEVINEYGKVIDNRIVKSNKDYTGENINLVFIRENGKYSGTDLLRYPFKIIHDELGINKCRFYDLRGTYATRISTNESKLRDVADLLGHKSIETTFNYYITSTEESKKKAINLYDEEIRSEIIKKVIKYDN